MEMQQVRYFLAVAEELNFTRAAEKCNVSQPSLSRAIRLLEEELGGQLFRRERSHTHLSDLGLLVLPHLRQVYEESAATKRVARDFTRLNKAKLKVGVMCTIAPEPIVNLLGAVAARHPGIEIDLADDNARTLDSRLIEGQLEVAIYCLPREEPDPVLHLLPLYRERMMIVVHPEHRLAQQNAINMRDLDGELYLQRSNCEFSGYPVSMFAEQGAVCETRHASERDDWILAMIAAGLGFGFMPEYAIRSDAVAARPLLEPEVWRQVNLVTVRGRPHSPAVGALVREAMRVNWHGLPVTSFTSRRAELVASA